METLAFGYGLAEAPCVDAADNLYFSDVVGGGVFQRSPEGKISTVLAKRRGCGGLVLHADGGVVVSGRNVVHVRDGLSRVLLEVDGALGFNDLTTDARGRVYVGSMRSGAFESGPRVPGELRNLAYPGDDLLGPHSDGPPSDPLRRLPPAARKLVERRRHGGPGL